MSTKEQELLGNEEYVRLAVGALEQLRADMRAALATYDASPGAKYDHADCTCTWCAFVRSIREAAADA